MWGHLVSKDPRCMGCGSVEEVSIFFVYLWLEVTAMRMADKCKLPTAGAMSAIFFQCAGCHNFMVSVVVSANNSGYEKRN